MDTIVPNDRKRLIDNNDENKTDRIGKLLFHGMFIIMAIGCRLTKIILRSILCTRNVRKEEETGESETLNT